ncbi:redox-sensitive bicupin YhaK (pirin superfamily) [Rhizobium sp. SG_E_25_P2]|uniref:pirin family protein n=1 Tax=Rhizobium sp. SG_E_25_P2 TaxID=2879942 RepID=UPI002473FC72|nr:pirin family protein [Rhizobium sp. SG_E_25_P2]MDH6266572.1 redox-sensitive bicupin YhaK (pirin superfamily) [Rhizobium sp. SG_E_25_P2]
MSFFPGHDPEPGDAQAVDQVELLIIPRSSDIGNFEVRRALPSAKRRMVGPFIFFDRMGPALLRAGQAMDVRPHPHIGLSTVTYLFDGEIHHRDSLGTGMVIKPGDINLMTSGRGIVHSERTPDNLRGKPFSISGLQTWLALPESHEEIDPVFAHTGVGDLPVFEDGASRGRVVIGSWQGLASPVKTPTDTVYVDLTIGAGETCPFPAGAEERAAYVLEGTVLISGIEHPADQLLVFRPGDSIDLTAGPTGCHIMLFGGEAMAEKRYIWWNFVSSSKERIEQAKEEWRTGKFDIVPGDEEEFIPLPAT